MKKIRFFVTGMLALAGLSFILQTLGIIPNTETPQIEVTEVPTEASKSVTSNTTTKTKETPIKEETTEEKRETTEVPSQKLPYNLAEMNIKITDSFNESVLFNQEGEDGYEWTVHIYELKLKESGAIHAIVNDSFFTLSDTEKTEVLNHVSSSVNMVVFIETEEDRPYYITAYDHSGDKVAQSHISNVLKYDFE